SLRDAGRARLARRRRGAPDCRMARRAGRDRESAMNGFDRRSLLRLTAGGIALAALPASRAAAAAGFDPPLAPMLYTRQLERELPDGARFAVGRRLAIRFVREAEGFRVEGEQVGVEVDA